jgi:hypothetical protein
VKGTIADTIRKVLKPHLFERWLRSHGKTAVVGEARCDAACPIACYLGEATGEIAYVVPGSPVLFSRTGEKVALPEWADEFAHLLDSMYANAAIDPHHPDPPEHRRLRDPDDQVEAREALTVLADEHTVRILDGTAELARHDRCWDRGQCIEIAAHVQHLVEYKRAARAHRGLDRVATAAPAAATLLEQAAARGENLGSITAALLRLLDRWGSTALQAAILDALQRGVPHPNAVRLALERARQASGQPPPVALVLPEHVARRDAPVRPHDLGSYDRQPDQPPDPQETPDD